MRIDPADPQQPDARQKDAFKKALELRLKAKAGPPRKPLPSPQGSAKAAAKTTFAAQRAAAEAHAFSGTLAAGFSRDVKGQKALASSRGESEVKSQTQATDRSHGMASQEQKAKQRIGELLARDLGQRPDAPPPAARVLETSKKEPPERALDAGAKPAERDLAPSKAEQVPEVSSVMALIEKVEVFVRSNRPTLSLSLGGALEGQLEIEKVGPGKVALTLRGGRKDPGAPERIRQALAARGLTVTRMRIG
jgi:hypothetical protein